MNFYSEYIENITTIRNWRKSYSLIECIEELLEDISEKYNGELITETEELDWNCLDEKKDRKTTFRGDDQIKNLEIQFSYKIPMEERWNDLSLEISSKTAGVTLITTQDPSVIMNVICSVVSSHDERRDDWIPVKSRDKIFTTE